MPKELYIQYKTLSTAIALASSSEGIGFDDYIDFVNAEYNGEDLSSTINNKFQLISDHLDLLNDPFQKRL